MNGPLASLLNTRLFGTYLRLRLAFLLGGALAAVGGALALGVGGVWGLLPLLGVTVGLLFVLAAALVLQ